MKTGNLKPQYDFNLVKQPYLNTVYLSTMLNPKMEGGKGNQLAENTKLRQALNYAIDRDKIVKYVLKGKRNSRNPWSVTERNAGLLGRCERLQL